MITLTIPTTQAQQSDVVTHADGHDLGRTYLVIKPLAPVSDDAFAPEGVKLQSSTTVEHFLYPDNTHTITVQRAEPKRPTRTVNGVQFTRVESTRSDDGFVWVSQDGRLEIGRHETHSPCSEAHPVRITESLRRQVREAHNHHAQWTLAGAALPFTEFPRDLVHAVLDGRRGYRCPGMEDHSSWAWGVWDLRSDDWFNEAPNDPSFKQAATFAVSQVCAGY